MSRRTSSTITALWANIDEYLRSGGVIQPGTILYHIAANQAFGAYDEHDDEFVYVINMNPENRGRAYRVPREELMINLLWQANLN